MDTAKILEIAQTLNNELNEHGVNEVWIMRRKIFKVLLKLAQYQLNHEGMNQRGKKVYVEFFGDGPSMTLEDRKTVKEAIALDKQMGKRLREDRLSDKKNNI